MSDYPQVARGRLPAGVGDREKLGGEEVPLRAVVYVSVLTAHGPGRRKRFTPKVTSVDEFCIRFPRGVPIRKAGRRGSQTAFECLIC